MNRTPEEITEEFFKRRWPKKNIIFEKECGYFYEWVDKFKWSEPEIFMDIESLEVWLGMANWLEGAK